MGILEYLNKFCTILKKVKKLYHIFKACYAIVSTEWHDRDYKIYFMGNEQVVASKKRLGKLE